MSIRKPLIIEFTGTPYSGKTTLIQFLRHQLESMGYSVETKDEAAEKVPACIPKKVWKRNVWITLGQLQALIETSCSSADIVLLDRGFYDSMFWANFLKTQDVCSDEESHSLATIIEEINNPFDLEPDHLFIIDVSASVSSKRKYKAKNGKSITSSIDIELYKTESEKFFKNINIPTFRLDTTSLTFTEMQEIVLDKIMGILKEM